MAAADPADSDKPTAITRSAPTKGRKGHIRLKGHRTLCQDDIASRLAEDVYIRLPADIPRTSRVRAVSPRLKRDGEQQGCVKAGRGSCSRR